MLDGKPYKSLRFISTASRSEREMVAANGQRAMHAFNASPDFEAMFNQSAGLQSGSWLTETVLFVLRALPADWARPTAIAMLPAGAAGLLFGVLYHTYRDSDWSAGGATLLLALLGSHALIVYSITSAGLVLPALLQRVLRCLS